jgi:glycosyltransferase involved in cell wall biosynthesis
MKILYLNYEFPPLGGGGGVANYWVAKFLASRHQVTVITSGFANLPRVSSEGRLRILRVPVLARQKQEVASFFSMLSFIFSSFWVGYKFLRRNKVDLINTHFALPSGVSGFFLARLFKIPHLVSTHGGDLYDPSKKLSPHRNFFLKKVVRDILKSAQKIVVVSSEMKRKIAQYYQVSSSIEIIPNPLPPPLLERFSSLSKLPQTGFTIVSVGRLIKRKRYELFLKILSQFKYKDKILFYLIGQGPSLSRLKKIKKQFNLKVEFLGYLSEREKYRYLSQADLFVLPSSHEAFGIVLLEAMAVGLPLLVHQEGGQTDFLTDGAGGFLVDFTQPEEVKKKLEKLIKDENLRRKMGERNKEKVKEYQIEKIGLKYEKLYQTMLSQYHHS